MHTSRHTRKNSGFSTQDEPLGLLGLEALTEAPNFHYATRSIYRLDLDAIVICAVFEKKTPKTPKNIIDVCQQRLQRYDTDVEERETEDGRTQEKPSDSQRLDGRRR